MAVAEALQSFGIEATIKWPNDIYVGDLKICGMLIENVLQGSHIRCSLSGIGVNVNQEVFVSNAPNPTSMKLITGRTFDKKEVLMRILQEMERLWPITIAAVSVACILCSAIKHISSSDLYVPMIFVLAVLIISLLTDGYFYGVLTSFVSVIVVNWAFTYPYMKLDFSIYGYSTTFLTMLAVSLVISTLTTRVHEQEKLRHDTEQAQLRANLLRAVSHDLRTPLTSIIGSISAVIDGGKALSEEQKAEMYTEDKMSDANREQVKRYIDGLWGNMCKAVSTSRSISVDKLNEYADNMLLFDDQKTLINRKLIDGLLYTDQVKGVVKSMLKIDSDESINQISVADMGNVKESSTDGEEIAVYYAYGNIVNTPLEASGGLLGNDDYIIATDVCKDLQKLADDEDVKAVVLRINSGGGSAYASEQMWHQIEMLKKKKPVVVSMGGMAASGGYYMSCNANWIVAEPTTLTGSIGIFGVIPDRSQLLTQKLGIKFDEVKTNKNSTFGSSARPMNADEQAILQSYINRGYSLFLKRVADGRKMKVS